MRCICGLEEPDGGRVYFSGEDITGVPPESRGIGLLFQKPQGNEDHADILIWD